MKRGEFHGRGFDEGTLTKLQLFELYLRAWLPVFLASARPPKDEIHVFDFFAGPGESGRGEPGSPLRVLRQMRDFEHLPGWSKVSIHAHFFDADAATVEALRSLVEQPGLCPAHVRLDLQTLPFDAALQSCAAVLRNPRAAKLLFIDQFGVAEVTDEIFGQMVSFPTSDFLFFLTSSTLHRFHDHSAIRQKITSPDDYYQVHRAALEFYRRLLPNPSMFFLAPFSIKKGSNIYGLIFGSAHPVGIDKFLQVAWKTDEINGEANFDINRDNLSTTQPAFPSLEDHSLRERVGTTTPLW